MAGLLVSLNIVDFSVCLKQEELDALEGVIDFTKYLRKKEDIGRGDSLSVSFKCLHRQNSIILRSQCNKLDKPNNKMSR